MERQGTSRVLHQPIGPVILPQNLYPSSVSGMVAIGAASIQRISKVAARSSRPGTRAEPHLLLRIFFRDLQEWELIPRTVRSHAKHDHTEEPDRTDRPQPACHRR